MREIIEARGLTAYAAGKLAGVDPGVVQRFLTGERDIRMETADRLALGLGLRLVEVARKGRARASGSARPIAMAWAGEGPDDADAAGGPDDVV